MSASDLSVTPWACNMSDPLSAVVTYSRVRVTLINENQLINIYTHVLSVAALQNRAASSSSVWDKLQSDHFSEVFCPFFITFIVTW